MCDFSLESVASRPARVGDKLETKFFSTGTTGFVDPAKPHEAVCLRPGTEIAFDEDVTFRFGPGNIKPRVAVFCQINQDKVVAHHDALDFPGRDSEPVLLTVLTAGLKATVLQLPADPLPAKEEQAEQPEVADA